MLDPTERKVDTPPGKYRAERAGGFRVTTTGPHTPCWLLSDARVNGSDLSRGSIELCYRAWGRHNEVHR